MEKLFIEPGSPWENGYIESFKRKLRDELLNGEIVDMLLEAKVLIEQRRREYSTISPHSSLDYRAPVPEATLLLAGCSATLREQPIDKPKKNLT